MIKLQIIGNLGHDNKLFTKTCRTHGGIHEDHVVVCPQCQVILVSITAKNGRKMMVSEGTVYPLATKSQQEREAQAISKRKNAMPVTYRFVILSFGDKENNIVTPPKIHPYLTTGRQVMIEINHAPIVSWYKANDGTIKCEVRLGIMYNENDAIKLLGKKEAARNQILPEESVQAKAAQVAPDAVATQLANLQKQLSELMAAHTPTAVEKAGCLGSNLKDVNVVEEPEDAVEEPADMVVETEGPSPFSF